MSTVYKSKLKETKIATRFILLTEMRKPKVSQCDILLPFLDWMDSDDLMPAVSAMEPEEEMGPRKTPERRLVCRRMRLLPGCLMVTPSADLLVEELPVDDADLMNGGEKEDYFTGR